MKIDMTSIDGTAAGSIELNDAIFGLEPRAGSHRPHGALAARQASGRHAQDARAAPTSPAPARRCTSRRAPAAPATARRACRSSAAAAGPSVRWCAATRTTCPRRCARWRSGTRCRRRPRTAAIVVWENAAARRGARRRLLQAGFDKIGLEQRADHRRRQRRRRISRSPRATCPQVDVLPVEGVNVYDILRREKLVLTRSAVDALEARLK